MCFKECSHVKQLVYHLYDKISLHFQTSNEIVINQANNISKRFLQRAQQEETY